VRLFPSQDLCKLLHWGDTTTVEDEEASQRLDDNWILIAVSCRALTEPHQDRNMEAVVDRIWRGRN
jgi:hypothetical protein